MVLRNFTSEFLLTDMMRTVQFHTIAYSRVHHEPQKNVQQLHILPRVYNKEGGRVSYSSIVPYTAVVRVQARLIIFTMCCTFTVYTTGQARCVTTHIRLPTMTP